RSGYPVLTPVNYVGSFSGGIIPRRQPYPVTEPSLNPTHYAEAVGRLNGGDTWTSRVWWDK
ncbi:MAG TPA: SusD/RagB family nutrient-binding outer membrane lipoprotein, partial [Chitinophaga sp.]